jgi:TPR repeat protein
VIQHTLQNQLRELKALFEEGLINKSDYGTQKNYLLNQLREFFATKQQAHKEALYILQKLHAENCLENEEYEREKKWFLQAMFPSTNLPSSLSQDAFVPDANGADKWATGGGHFHPSPEKPPQRNILDQWATGSIGISQSQQNPINDLQDPLVARVLLNRFRLEKLAGSGGMGRVYKCYDLHKENHYALKMLPPFLAQDHDLQKRMVREIRVNERLNHNGIVRTYDLFHQEGVGTFFTMDWLEGRTLEAFLVEARQHKQAPVLPLLTLTTILQKIAEALEHAHQRGVVHRDLKPANLMILPDYDVKIMDFGIAKVIENSTTKHTGMTGTFFYMAPEQMKGDAHVTPASDVYSLGVIVYEALTLELPIGRIVPPSQLCPELPTEVDLIILKALANRPTERYQHVPAFLKELLPLLCQEIEFKKLSLTLSEQEFSEHKKPLSKSFRLLQRMSTKEPRAMALLGRCFLFGWGVEKDYKKALELSEKSARESNDVEAQANLGKIYYEGLGVEKNVNLSFYWYTKAAEQEDTISQLMLGSMYSKRSAGHNHKKAFYWFSKAAEKDNAGAFFSLGEMYRLGEYVEQSDEKSLFWYNKLFFWCSKAIEKGIDLGFSWMGQMYKLGKYVEQNYEKAFYWFSKGAEQDQEDSQYMLGQMYYLGEYVEQNYEKAFYWCSKAVEQDNANAQFMLGQMYYLGEYVEQNYEKAFYWFSKGAEQDQEDSQFMLGQMYYLGEYVEQNYEKAFYWCSKAAKQDQKNSQVMLGQMYYLGEYVEQNYEKAFYWCSKAAEQDDANAQVVLGHMYYLEQNYKKAFYWLSKAAEQNHSDALCKLGHMYYVEENYEKALMWFAKAAEQNHSDALYMLGHMYYSGEYVEENYEKAFFWYSEAAEWGNENAQYMLGYMYHHGLGVAKNIKKAIENYKKAADNGSIYAQESLEGL